ncbi:MAG: response regulator [Muribaculaceae bacterium]|nr:response regulator [Muribaculaceae bacterium]MDE6819193.1 response regulator [Muribaculaceae bacterium]
MTQLTINIENAAILPHLKKILAAIDGISIAKPTKRKKSGLEEAYEDVKENRVNTYNSVEDFYKAMGI